jgi:lipopolysaccharide export system permease protein
MRIFDRYLLRQVIGNWLAVTCILLVILLTNQVARVLARAAEQQYPHGVVLELIWVGLLQNVTVIVPIGLLLGVVLALGRMYHDSEMAAAQACGISIWRLYVPIAITGVSVTALLAWLTLSVSPQAASRMFDLRDTALRAGRFAPVSPGKFRDFGGSGSVVYAQSADGDGTLRNVFVKRSRGNVIEVAVAKRATHAVSADLSLSIITLYDGERYEGVPGQANFRTVRFAENVIPVRLPDLTKSSATLDAATSSSLRGAVDREQRAEFQWRIALPLMAVVLTMLAVPLSKLAPRQGRYARVWLAVLLYFIYANLLAAGKIWLANGRTPEVIGLWWVHVVVGLIALGLIALPHLRARLRYRGVA